MCAIYSNQHNLLDLITRSLQIMKLSAVQFLQPALYWSKYFPQSLFLKHTQRTCLGHYDRRTFKPAWNTVQKHKLDGRCAWLSLLTVHVVLCEVDGHTGGHRNVTTSVHPLRICPVTVLSLLFAEVWLTRGLPCLYCQSVYVVHSVLLTCLLPTAGLGWTGKNIQVGGVERWHIT